MQNQLLERIDMIQESSIDAELDVCMSMVDIYTKTAMILENYSDEDCFDLFIFQEGEILDQAKGDKNESMIKRILLFIPRLIKAILKKVFGSKKKQVDQMADKIMQTPIDPSIQEIEVELTFDLNTNPGEVLGIIDGYNHDVSDIATKLENKQQFTQQDVSDVDKLINHFNATIDAIKKAQKHLVKIRLADQNAFKEHVKSIKNRWDMALEFMKTYISYFNKDDIAKKSQISTDQMTLTFLSKVQQMISIMGNIATSVENIYANEMKQIYDKLNIQDDEKPSGSQSTSTQSETPQPVQSKQSETQIQRWIREKNVESLRNIFRMQMYGDPLMSQFQDDLKACDEWLYEPNVDLDTPLNLPESRWNKAYWNSLMLQLKENFSRERFDLARKVAKYLMDNGKWDDERSITDIFKRK